MNGIGLNFSSVSLYFSLFGVYSGTGGILGEGKKMEILKCPERSKGRPIHMTPEERLWFDRINRNRLWYRYAPPHIQSSFPIDIFVDWAKAFEVFDFINSPPKPDKRTRNEIGQEKHNSRKCKECGR